MESMPVAASCLLSFSLASSRDANSALNPLDHANATDLHSLLLLPDGHALVGIRVHVVADVAEDVLDGHPVRLGSLSIPGQILDSLEVEAVDAAVDPIGQDTLQPRLWKGESLTNMCVRTLLFCQLSTGTWLSLTSWR